MSKNLAVSTMYMTLASLVFMLSGYLINIWLGRTLGPADYGVYGIVISTVTLINLTQTAGLPQAVSKFISSDIKNSEAIFRTGLILQIISTVFVTLIFFIFSGMLASLLKDPKLTTYLQLAALIFPIYGVFALLTGYYNGMHLFGKQALIHIIYSFVKIFAIITLAFVFRLYGVVLGFILSALIALIIGIHLPKKTANKFPYKKLIQFSLPLIAVAIFSNLMQTIDLFFVKALLNSDKSTGFYTASQNVSIIPYYGLNSLSVVLFPSISKSVSLSLHDETKRLISNFLRFSILVITPGVLLVSATSGQILKLLFSSAYQPGASALSILVVGSGFFTIFVLLSTIISSSGSPYKSALLSGVGALISSVSCFLLIPILGLKGAALSTTFATGSMMVIASIIVHRQFRVLYPLTSFLKVFLASAVIYLIAKILPLPTFALPVMYIFLIALYVFLLVIMKEVTKDDISLIKPIIPKSLKKFKNEKNN